MRPAAYRGFANQSTGYALRYLALLVLLVSIPTFLFIYYDMSAGVEKLAGQIRQSWPDFKLAGGVLEVDAPMPMIIDNGDGSLTIVDTSGKTYLTLLEAYPSAGYVITRDQIFQRREGRARVIDFKTLHFITFTKQILVHWMAYFRWISVLIIIFGFPFLYVFKLLEAAAAALVAMLAGFIFRSILNYSQAFRISVYALTIPFIAQGLQKALWPDCPYPSIMFYAIFLIYVVIGVRGATRSRIVL